MLEPATSEADAARIAILPLEWSRKEIGRLFRQADPSADDFYERLDDYGADALDVHVEPTPPVGPNSYGEIAVFATVTALRVEFANPLADSPYREQYPEMSAERRMMNRPLRKHPGLSKFTRNVRDHYICTVLETFQNRLTEPLQCEVVAALLAPGPEDQRSTPQNPAQLSNASRSFAEERTRLVDRVRCRDEGFEIPAAEASARCLAEPLHESLSLRFTNDVPPVENRGEWVFVPTEVVLTKLANYALHGWYRLVTRLYSTIPRPQIQSWIEQTPQIREKISDRLEFQRPSEAFRPHYGAASENPLRDPDARDPIPKPDKRLVTAIDAIRATPTLNFSDPILTFELYDAIREFYPSPDRPSNAVTNQETLKTAVANARSDQIVESDLIDAYTIPPPIFTPFHYRTEPTLWKQYRHGLAVQTAADLQFPDSRYLSAQLPENFQPQASDAYAAAIQAAEQATVTKSRRVHESIHTVSPLVMPHTVDGVSPDEVLFLTRVGLAMTRRLNSYSLPESMASFDKTRDGANLAIDFEKLIEEKMLTEHGSRQTYYSVPWKVRKQLNVGNVSQDGWGEQLPSEQTPHRVGVDLTAFYIASREDVDRVVRYMDVWRLNGAACWPAVNHLERKRLDVVGFSGGEPQIVAEVETDSGGRTGTKTAATKLRAFPDNTQRYFVTPSGDHLPALVSRLNHFDDVAVDLGEPQDGRYRPAAVRDEIGSGSGLSRYFDDVLTFDNLRTRLPDDADFADLSTTIIGNI